MNQTKLTCFSLGCSFTTFDKAEMMLHEKVHEAENEKYSEEIEEEEPEPECEDCGENPCQCNKDNGNPKQEVNDCE